MKESMALLKRKHEQSMNKLTETLNELKKMICKKDIADYMRQRGFVGKQQHNVSYGQEVANNVFVRIGHFTDGTICLDVEDRRGDAFLWSFEIVFEPPFYQSPLIFLKGAGSAPNEIIRVQDVCDDADDKVQYLVQDAIYQLEQSTERAQALDAKTALYSYRDNHGEVSGLKSLVDIIDVVLERTVRNPQQ